MSAIEEAIGSFVIAAARLELATADLVASLMASPLAVFAVRGQNPDAIKGLAKSLLNNQHIPDPWNGRARETLEAVWSIQDQRNYVVHGLWIPKDDVQWTASKPKRHQISHLGKDFTVESLNHSVVQMHDLMTRLFVLSWNLSSAPGEPMEWPRSGGAMNAPMQVTLLGTEHE